MSDSGLMDSVLIQIVLPFILSACIVISVTLIAEKFGTKVGGILGTLPHLIIIAFVFIAMNKGEDFAARAAVVVPAEMGINILFLFVFAHYSHQPVFHALGLSLIIWLILSSLLVLSDFSNIFLSILLYVLCWGYAYIMFENVKKIGSVGKVKVRYTWGKLAGRGTLAGMVIAFSVFMSNIGSVFSGIFSVFPAMFLSTMVISRREHGPDFVRGLAKAMIFGTPSVMSYAVWVHFFYPIYGIIIGTLVSVVLSVSIGLGILSIRHKLL